MSLWQAYRSLSTRTRLIVGGGIMSYAVFGLFVSDKAEQVLGLVPTEDDKRRLNEALPKIHRIDREE